MSSAFAISQEPIVLSDSIMLKQALNDGGVTQVSEAIEVKLSTDIEKMSNNPLFYGFSLIKINGKDAYFKKEDKISILIEPKN